MRTGKLPPALLSRLLRRIPRHDPRVLLGSGIGEDAAVIDVLGAEATGAEAMSAGTERNAPRYLVAKTDPITFATDQAGWYAVHVNANDIACAGAVPRWFLASALLPESWEEQQVADLFDQLIGACTPMGISLVGGHTEITGGLDRPIIVGCMLGEVERDRVVRTGGGRPGDVLLLTQGMAIEGTAVLARDAVAPLRHAGVDQPLIERAQRLLYDPGISVVAAARALCDALMPGGALHSLHDPTEGGVAAGIWEVAEASSTGALVDEAAVPVLEETAAVCHALGLDPWGLLASGALLAAVAPEASAHALSVLRERGIPATVIGQLTPRDTGLHLRCAGGAITPWPMFDRDEVARHFESASSSPNGPAGSD